MRVGSEVNGGTPDPVGDVFNSGCVGRVIVEHVTGRWVVLILAALRGGPLRFYELRDRIDGVSEKMLSQKLRILARDGLVERAVEPSNPPKVSYQLTPLGRGVTRPLQQLVRWIARHAPDVVAAQERYDTLTGTGPPPDPG